jgi:hypothetical protein
VGLLGAACLFGTTAAPALAHEFTAFRFNHTASPSEPFKTVTRGIEGTKYEFVFPRKTIKCEAAIGKGLMEENPTKSLQFHVAFSKCGYYPLASLEEHFPATVKGGITIVFEVNGSAEFLGNGEGEELEYGVKAELKETATKIEIPAGKFCTFIIPTQPIPARAKLKPEEEFAVVSYSNTSTKVEETPTKLKLFPGGFQHKVIFSYDLKPVKFQFKEETQCFEDESNLGHRVEGNATFKGKLLSEVVSGNLEFH